ncbi:MAG: GNAT family N-acetyltransferase [Gilvibacter sp.]
MREFSTEDATAFYKMNSDPEVIRYTGDVPFASPNEARNFIANYSHYKEYGYGRWAICLKPSLQFIGFCGLKYHPKPEITEVGYRLFREHWGMGIATEASLAAIHHGFNELGLKAIYAHVDAKNPASARVLIKCGMQFVGHDTHEGAPIDLYKIEKPTHETT